MRILRLGIALTAAVFAAGCAHPMMIKPDIASLAVPAEASRIQKSVGLYISAENRNKQVTTPGGGGDKVSYRPYADIETGLYKVLGNVFQNVEVLSSISEGESIAKHSLVYIVVPEIATTSSSSGFFTWMATDFTVDLSCKISDVAGRTLTTVSSTGTGHADFSELKSDMSRAGERASQDALTKLQASLLQAPELRK